MKKIRKRLLTGLLCMLLAMSNIAPAGLYVQAAEPELQLADESTGEDPAASEEDAADNTEDSNDVGSEDEDNEQDEVTDGTSEEDTDLEAPKEDTDTDVSEEDTDRGSDIEGGGIDQEESGEGEQPENELPEEELPEEEQPEEELPEEELYEDEQTLLTSDEDLPSGEYNDITWKIDAEGTLIVEGSGDFAPVSVGDKEVDESRAPWYEYVADIRTAKINVTGMTDASYMFYKCRKLKSVDFTNFNTENVTNMSYMFADCGTDGINGTILDLSSLDTSNVTDMSYMFFICRYNNRHGLNLSGCDTSNVTNMNHMFYAATISADIWELDTSSVTDMSYMFASTEHRVSPDFSQFDTSNVTNMSHMFQSCNEYGDAHISLDLSSFNTVNVTDMSFMFCRCNILNVDVSSFDTSSVTNMDSMFYGCESLTSLDLSSFDTSSVTDMEYMFYWCKSLTSLDLSSFCPVNVTSMYFMFYHCSALKELDLSNFNTSSVKYMDNMFYRCESLERLDLSSFDTSSVKRMGEMFGDCNNLRSLDLSSFDTSSVERMEGMFMNCESLEHLDLSSFDTSSVESMNSMFEHCKNIESLDLSNFNVGQVDYMKYMFWGCSSLVALDMSFDMGENNSPQVEDMFLECPALSVIAAPYNFGSMVPLPTGKSSDKWYDSAGNRHTILPWADSSIILTKNSWSKASEHIEVKKTRTDYESWKDVTLDDLTVKYYGNDGSVRRLANINYDTNLDEINLDTTESGSKTLIITYEGESGVLTAEIELTITYVLTTENVTITLPEESESYTYDGTPKTPVPVLTLNGTTITLDKTDYTVSYRNNVNAYEGNLTGGNAKTAPTVIITGRGDYKGTVTKAFKITKADAPAEKAITVYTSNCKEMQEPQNYDLSGSFAAYGKKTKYEVESYQEDDTIDGSLFSRSPYVDVEGHLIYKPNVGTQNDFATVRVKVSFANYKDSVITVKIVQREKEQAVLTGITMKDSVYNGKQVSYSGVLDAYSIVGTFDWHNRQVKYHYQGHKADGTVYDSDNAPIDAGDYILTMEISDQYREGIGEYPFTIKKAPVTIQALDRTLLQDEKLPAAYEYRVTGLFQDDELVTKPSFTYNVAEEKIDTGTPGIYELIPRDAEAGANYEITDYRSGRLIVAEERVACMVSFDLAGHEQGDPIDSIPVKSGDLIARPADPAAEGCIFTGWYRDQTYTKAWDFASDIVQADTTLYACWLEQDANVNLYVKDIKPQDYTGSAIKPAVYVYDSDGVTLLKSGRDYTITYKANTAASVDAKGNALPGGVKCTKGSGKNEETITDNGFKADQPHVIIKGKGNYAGTVYKNFQISAADISAEDESGQVTLAPGFVLKYTEQLVGSETKPQTPFSSLKYKKAMTLGKDYTVELKASADVKYINYNYIFEPYNWSDTTKPTANGKKYTAPAIPKNYYGTFTMVITGKGNYKGTVSKSIIVAKDADHSIQKAAVTLGSNLKSIKFDESKEKIVLTPANYNIEDKKYYRVNEQGVESTDPEANTKDIFYVKIGKDYLTYKGENSSESDYSISYDKNDAVGTATMTITGNPARGYTGTKSITFKITGTPFNAKNVVVKSDSADSPDRSFKTEMSYTGKAITQNQVLLTNGKEKTDAAYREFQYGTDYTIRYKNNLKKGTATMTFTAKPESGYSGSFNKTFKITAARLAKEQFSFYGIDGSGPESIVESLYTVDADGTIKFTQPVAYAGDGAKIPNKIRLVNPNESNTVLQEGTDYTVKYTRNTAAAPIRQSAKDSPAMTITGKGNYTGKLVVLFEIKKAEITESNPNLSLTAAAVAYDKKKAKDHQYTPAVTVKDKKKTLKRNTDYTVEYKNCTQEQIEKYLTTAAFEDRPYAVIKAKDSSNYSAGNSAETGIMIDLTVYDRKLAAKTLYVVYQDENYIYNTGKIEPEVSVYYGAAEDIKKAAAAGEKQEELLTASDGYALTKLTLWNTQEGGDYTLAYGANTAAGANKGSVTVTGRGRYTGSVTVKFKISQKDVYK